MDNQKQVKEEKDVKVILLGESGVGKTCIINRYINNVYNNSTPSTLGTAFSVKEIKKGNIKYNVNVWDTTGQEKYHSVTNLFINGSNIVILVYAITSDTSFKGLDYWYNSLKEKLEGENYILAIIGSKCDLAEEEVVSEEEGKNYAKSKKAFFKLVSAKEDPEGINKLFDSLLDELIKSDKLDNKFESCVVTKPKAKGKKKGFC